ncbi:uncharacterized protein IL334_007016 [Kwoniella shivajii]|uniref:Uncharacterized protein n=1 Tax=Kwoniella shivajii TaxID=564305 RepID=A0ABZ1D7Z6_9TREE|nr:hypothetical protein IL334_007016 [Kwoniella shivajii]
MTQPSFVDSLAQADKEWRERKNRDFKHSSPPPLLTRRRTYSLNDKYDRLAGPDSRSKGIKIWHEISAEKEKEKEKKERI